MDGADLPPLIQKIVVVLIKTEIAKKKSANSIKNCGLYTIYKIVSIVHTDTHVLLAGNNFFAASYVFFLCDIL